MRTDAEQELALECLRLANNAMLSTEQILHNAAAFYDFVLGSRTAGDPLVGNQIGTGLLGQVSANPTDPFRDGLRELVRSEMARNNAQSADARR